MQQTTEVTSKLSLSFVLMFLMWPIFVTAGVLWFVDFVKTNARAPVVQAEPKDWRPTIPHCDKPLWDRIREGCDD